VHQDLHAFAPAAYEERVLRFFEASFGKRAQRTAGNRGVTD